MSKVNNNHTAIDATKLPEQFYAMIDADHKYKSDLISNTFTGGFKALYDAAVTNTLEDFTGVAEAYKAGAIGSEQEMIEQMKLFMEEYAVKLVNIIKEQTTE